MRDICLGLAHLASQDLLSYSLHSGQAGRAVQTDDRTDQNDQEDQALRMVDQIGWNGRLNDDQGGVRNSELNGRRSLESNGVMNKVVSRFVDEALGRPSGTQGSSVLLWG
jgi:hypothetical protein